MVFSLQNYSFFCKLHEQKQSPLESYVIELLVLKPGGHELWVFSGNSVSPLQKHRHLLSERYNSYGTKELNGVLY